MTGGKEVSRASRPAVYIDEPRKGGEALAWVPGLLRFCFFKGFRNVSDIFLQFDMLPDW
ncbi:hypothetical protein ACFSF2_03020 [Paenibacillus rhizophilus]